MADVKANIMLTLAVVMTTFSIGYLSDPLLRWPVVVLILFCVVTVFFAAYAVCAAGVSDIYSGIDEQWDGFVVAEGFRFWGNGRFPLNLASIC